MRNTRSPKVALAPKRKNLMDIAPKRKLFVSKFAWLHLFFFPEIDLLASNMFVWHFLPPLSIYPSLYHCSKKIFWHGWSILRRCHIIKVHSIQGACRASSSCIIKAHFLFNFWHIHNIPLRVTKGWRLGEKMGAMKNSFNHLKLQACTEERHFNRLNIVFLRVIRRWWPGTKIVNSQKKHQP